MAGEFLLYRTLSAVERSFGIEKSDIVKKNRNASVARARAAAYKILVSVMGASWNEAGAIFGRSRRTVEFGVKAHERWMATDRHYAECFEAAVRFAAQPGSEFIQWVPAKTRLPNPQTIVLVCVAGQAVFLGFRDSGQWRWISSEIIQREVTHWADVPKGPTA